MKSKISPKIFLFLKANKILKQGFNLDRNLTLEEIILESKNFLRKHEKGNLDDHQKKMFFQMEIADWQTLIS
jgi:hypothetical protein